MPNVKLPPAWLPTFIDDVLDGTGPIVRLGNERARRALWCSLQKTGLLYGAPLPAAEMKLSDEMGALRPLLRFVESLTQAARIIVPLTSDDVCSAEIVRRRLTAALAFVYVGSTTSAVISKGRKSRAHARAIGRLGVALRRRRYLAGNPLVGLTVHHAFAATDAASILEILAGPGLSQVDEDHARACLVAREKEQDALVSAIGTLTLLRDDVDPTLIKSAVGWHMRHLGLSRARAARLTVLAKSGGEPEQIAGLLPPAASLRFLFSLMIVARVDGRVSDEERAFLADLATRLQVGRLDFEKMLQRVERFCAAQRKHLDPLAYALAFELEGGPVPVKLARALVDNAQSVWTEIRETGDLALLLAKRSSGQKLTADEVKRMREQLLDVARVIPGLAVFGLPGGALLLPILTRLLPFDLRPSAFRPGAFRAFDAPDATLATKTAPGNPPAAVGDLEDPKHDQAKDDGNDHGKKDDDEGQKPIRDG